MKRNLIVLVVVVVVVVVVVADVAIVVVIASLRWTPFMCLHCVRVHFWLFLAPFRCLHICISDALS